MAKVHTVVQGEGIPRIAFAHGFAPDTLWDHPENADLRTLRVRAEVLAPGDAVFIPDLRQKVVPAVTARRHRFRRTGVPAKLRMRMLDGNDEPLTNTPFTASVDGEVEQHGVTDADGVLEITVSPGARSAVLRIRDEDHHLAFGYLDPVALVTGVQGRLRNLGFYKGPDTTTVDERTRAALRAFQIAQHLDATGEADEATREKLEALHDAAGRR